VIVLQQNKIRIFILVFIVIFTFLSASSFAQIPGTSAHSAIVMDVKTGRILYQNNIHQEMPMASTTKIMTTLVALEKSDLDTIVKVPNHAVGVEGSSIYLGDNEKIRMEDLLYGLMLRSGNDAGVAIATHVAGSVDKFVELMNKKAYDIGALHTHFMNPHGLHHSQHYTTAYDLALISRKALQNNTFKKIVKTKVWTVQRERLNQFYNKNKTVYEYEGGDGVKIGYTRAAGRCLVASATRNGMQLVCVVLNDGNWFQDAYSLLDYAFEHYKPYKILKKDTALKTMEVINGKKTETKIVSEEDVIIPMTEGEKDKIRVVFDVHKAIAAPVSRKTKVGKARIYLEDRLMYTTNLFTREDIPIKETEHRMIDFLRGIKRNIQNYSMRF
jgi:D-alanyl-D-alanine carboxypeptidase (penicillin-binding protein 5/6)